MKKPRKKVLFLITKATWGGAQRYVFDLATHLPVEQFETAVAYGMPGRLKKMLEEKNIPLYPLPALGRDVALLSDVKSFFAMWKLFRREKPDVLHVNSSKAAALGALAARFARVPRIVFTAHGWPFKENRNFIARAAIYAISWFTAALSDTTIVVSKRDEAIGKKMWLVGKKIHFVPLGIETPAFLSREEAWKAIQTHVGHAVSYVGNRVISIGELTKNKGYRYAIDAIACLKQRGINVDYFIISDGELRSELEAQARDRGVADRIHFLGFVENAATYLKAFDIFLLPSIKEGTPYVLLEAAAAGIPIVATSAVDIGSVRPADAAALAYAIERWIKSHDTKTMPRVFTLAKMIEGTEELYG